MPSFQEQKNGLFYQFAYLGHTCGITNSGPVSKPIYIKQGWRNDKISRTRPDGPLWMYPTPLPKQWTNECWPEVEEIEYFYNHTRRISTPSGFVRIPCSYRYLSQIVGSWRNPGFNDWPDETNWQLEARLRVKDELANLGETLFEYRESARMFRTLAETLWDAFRTVRYAKKPTWRYKKGFYTRMPLRLRKRLTPASLPASFIAAEFGIKPLMNDCFLAYDTMYNRVQLPIYRRIYAKGTSGDANDPDGGWSRSDRATLYMELIPERDLVTLGNPFELAWNLIPFSLVVDWVIPIGETLSALDALKNVKWVKGVLSRKDRFRMDRALNPNAQYGYSSTRNYVQDYRSHERFVLNSIPFAESPLQWKPSRSYGHVLKGLSLLYLLRGYGRGGTFRPVNRPRWSL